MRRAVIASVLVARAAVADDAEDPRKAFGLPPKPKQPPAEPAKHDDARDVFGLGKAGAPAANCEDGRTLGCASATDPFDPIAPMAMRTWLPAASYLLRLPVSDARHDNVAHFATGASRDDVGPAFAGATGLENAWTIEGAPVENPRNGNIETRVPLTFATGITVLAGGFGARDRVGLGGSIDVELRRGGDSHEAEAYAWTGYTETARERPIAPATYQLRRLGIEAGPEVAFSMVATGPLPAFAGGRTWYAIGVAGNIGSSEVTWKAARLVDADGDGVPDGLPGIVALAPIETTSTRSVDHVIPEMLRTGWRRGPHDVALSLVTNASRDTFFLANATQQAAGVERSTLVADGIATWKGTWRDHRARVQLAWHRSDRHESARDRAAANVPQLLSAYVPAALAEDPTLAAACSDANDPEPDVPNCPIPFGFFASAGAGQLVDTVGDRPTVTAEVARRIDRHVVRAGGTFEDTRLITRSRYTGGELDRSLFDGHLDRARFLGGACGDEPDTPCTYANEYELNYRTRYTAAYVEDTFTPVPRIRVDGGLRWELMWVGPRLHASNELAPRLGLVWDALGNGAERTSRVWASMGRSYALLPAGVGSSVIARNQVVRDVELGDIHDRNIERGNVFSVCHVDQEQCDGIEPATQDEVAGGIDAGIVKGLRAGVWLQRRSLRRGIETVLARPDGEAYFDNPGRDGRIPALRESTVVAADLVIAPSPKQWMRMTYLWGKTLGSWVGPFDPRQGVTQYAGTDWDLDATNLYGRLPTDPGHRIAFEGERRFQLAATGSIEWAASTRLVVTSGRPRNVLADSDLGIVQLLPRGSVGRNPMLSQANVRLAGRWRGVDVTLDVFNAWDRKEPVTTNEIYAGGEVHPIVGGTLEDLVFVKSESCGDLGCTAGTPIRRTAFGLPTSFQAPRSFVLGAHHVF